MKVIYDMKFTKIKFIVKINDMEQIISLPNEYLITQVHMYQLES